MARRRARGGCPRVGSDAVRLSRGAAAAAGVSPMAPARCGIRCAPRAGDAGGRPRQTRPGVRAAPSATWPGRAPSCSRPRPARMPCRGDSPVRAVHPRVARSRRAGSMRVRSRHSSHGIARLAGAPSPLPEGPGPAPEPRAVTSGTGSAPAQTSAASAVCHAGAARLMRGQRGSRAWHIRAFHHAELCGTERAPRPSSHGDGPFAGTR